LFFLPLIFSTSHPLSEDFIRKLLAAFVAGVMLAAFVCVLLFLIHGLPSGSNFRVLSVFKPHIRFSLETVFAVFILCYYVIIPKQGQCRLLPHMKSMVLLSAILLTAFLFFLNSLTGIAIFLTLAITIAFYKLTLMQKPRIKYTLLIVTFSLIVAIGLWLTHIWSDNFIASLPVSLEKFTANHNAYTHNLVSGIMENGHYTDVYVCESELRKEWKEMSPVPFDQTDLRGQPLFSTIKRYLSSRGLRKDSAGLHQLSQEDLSNITKGLPNYKFRENPRLAQRIYETLWEIHVYQRSGFLQDHSLVQRMAFGKIAFALIRQHPWLGVGPGNVENIMKKQAQLEKYEPSKFWNGKPHNQFAFFLLSFGIPGFLWIMFGAVYPVLINRSYRLLLFNIFTGIMIISMLTLDTLESFDSIVFFTFFYSLFVFTIPQPSEEGISTTNTSL